MFNESFDTLRVTHISERMSFNKKNYMLPAFCVISFVGPFGSTAGYYADYGQRDPEVESTFFVSQMDSLLYRVDPVSAPNG